MSEPDGGLRTGEIPVIMSGEDQRLVEAKLEQYRALLQRRESIEEAMSKEELLVCNQYSQLVRDDCMVFNRLPEGRPAGVVHNTVYVTKTPSPIRAYSTLLGRYGYTTEYLLGLLWLVRHPTFAIRVSEIPRLVSIGRRPESTNISQEVFDFVYEADREEGTSSQYYWSEDELARFAKVFLGDEVFGSAYLLVYDEVCYTPLWPTQVVYDEGRFGEWGSAAMRRV